MSVVMIYYQTSYYCTTGIFMLNIYLFDNELFSLDRTPSLNTSIATYACLSLSISE